MGTSSKELARKLLHLAKRQYGCFTAAQAVETGYADSVHLYHVRTGSWIRLSRGIYRLASQPDSPEARCMAALLWTRDRNGIIQGFLSSETVEALQSETFHEDQPVHITVDKSFRRSTSTPDGIHLHTTDKRNHKTSKFRGFPVAADTCFIPPAPAEGLSNGKPSADLDGPDYYDWLDYQAVRCIPGS